MLLFTAASFADAVSSCVCRAPDKLKLFDRDLRPHPLLHNDRYPIAHSYHVLGPVGAGVIDEARTDLFFSRNEGRASPPLGSPGPHAVDDGVLDPHSCLVEPERI